MNQKSKGKWIFEMHGGLKAQRSDLCHMINPLRTMKRVFGSPQIHLSLIKPNFNGALRRNLGLAEFEGIIQNKHEKPKILHATNNSVELQDVEFGLRLADDRGMRKLQVEGDYQEIINMLKKINQYWLPIHERPLEELSQRSEIKRVITLYVSNYVK